MAIIKAPNEQYNGISATIKFENGIGQTDDKKLIRWFEEHGYAIQKDDKAANDKKGNKKGDKIADSEKDEILAENIEPEDADEKAE